MKFSTVPAHDEDEEEGAIRKDQVVIPAVLVATPLEESEEERLASRISADENDQFYNIATPLEELEERSIDERNRSNKLAMEIISVFLMSLFAIFILIWSVVIYQLHYTTPAGINELAAGFFMFAVLCFTVASPLDAVIRSKEGGVRNMNIIFGCSIISSICWIIYGILQIRYINQTDIQGQEGIGVVLFMIGSVFNAIKAIHYISTTKRSRYLDVLGLIEQSFLSVANAFFMGGSVYFLTNSRTINNGYYDDAALVAWIFHIGGSLSYLIANILQHVKLWMSVGLCVCNQ